MPREKAVVTKAMRAVTSKNTSPEMALRSALWRRGLRYRLHNKNLPGKPDIVFGPSKVAVFVDGDYWHGNQWRLRKKKSLIDQLKNVNNKAYWIKKIEGNIARDKRNNSALKKAGWTVVRLWESDILKRPEWCADRVEKVVVNGCGEKKTR